MPGRYQYSLPDRPSRDGWFRVGSIDVTTTAALVGLGVLSMFWYAIDKSSLAKLAFSGSAVRSGEVWRLVTWPIVNPPNNIWVLLTLAFFWFVGHRIEDRIGRHRFTRMVAAMTLLPALVVTVLRFDLDTAYGLRVLAISLLVVFAFDSPGATWFFNIPLWIVAVAFVVLDALQYLGDRWFAPLVLELAAIAVGLVVARQYGMLDDLTFIPRHGARRPQRATRGAVVAGPWDKQAQVGLTSVEHAELDTLLDKTSAQGLDSLSRTEKARLNELSKKLRAR